MMTIHTHHDQTNTWTNMNVWGLSFVSSLRYVFFNLLFALLMIIITSTSMKIAMTINVHQHRTNIGMNVNRAWDASASRCHIEFRLEHSLSISVHLCLFPSVPRPSTLFLLTILFFSVPFCRICVRTILPFPSVLSFQPSTLGSDPTSVSSDLTSYCFRYCSAITPISPTPSHSDLLLFSASYCTMFRSDLIVLLCIITTSCSSLAPACKPTCVNPNIPVFPHSFPILISLEIFLSPSPCFRPPPK